MTLLAFDQSSRTTGYAVFRDGELIAHHTFTLTDPDFGIRLYKIRQRVIDLINTYHPSLVAFEEIQYQNNVGNNVDTFKKLAEVYGLFLELLTELNIPYQIVSASTWKSVLHIGGSNREAQKHNAQNWVVNQYNIHPTQDECDAICLGASLLGDNSRNSINDWSN